MPIRPNVLIIVLVLAAMAGGLHASHIMFDHDTSDPVAGIIGAIIMAMSRILDKD